jgi:hypothetical protein
VLQHVNYNGRIIFVYLLIKLSLQYSYTYMYTTKLDYVYCVPYLKIINALYQIRLLFLY